jgi:putative hemolysin
MTTLAFQGAIVVLLILLNGLFAMSETALVSARKADLRQRADAGDDRARSALELANAPNRFLSRHAPGGAKHVLPVFAPG